MLLLCPLLSGYQACVRRRGREAEGTRLLNERAPKGHRGFESLRLRQLPVSQGFLTTLSQFKTRYNKGIRSLIVP